MKIKFCYFLFIFFILGMGFFHAPKLWASEHGCSIREPDRDGDGVPDKNDAYPDDPSRTGAEEKF